MLLKVCLLTMAMIWPTSSIASDFFSLSALKMADEKPLASLHYIKSTDNIFLAYRPYIPTNANAVLIFFHGGGAHSGLSYNHLGIGLRDNFNIAVYMPDIRGHGSSEGARGDAPNKEQVWADINTIIQQARHRYPQLPIYVGGHSSGAGLALNYSNWSQRENIDGYVFLAPYFGYKSETNLDDENNRVAFSDVNTLKFILNSVSFGLLAGHDKAVMFNFPEQVLKNNPEIVTFNTVNMSNALTPSEPAKQIANLTRFGLWIGENDEAFDAQKVTRFADTNSTQVNNEIKLLKDDTHFSIILSGAEYIGRYIQESISE
ncbi:alpha/beta hydrolase [Moritella sp. JT01]|uniref:alpha/beta hydrolase n=1 Tax=Moritella sp. JT01 TaxID=756698 RepID=UPI000AA14CB4|nr:alpha/beta hydrolase [Moritella sp. JT01]